MFFFIPRVVINVLLVFYMFRTSYIHHQEHHLYSHFLHDMFPYVNIRSLAGGRMYSSVHFVGLHYITEILPLFGSLKFQNARISYLPSPFIVHLNKSVIF